MCTEGDYSFCAFTELVRLYSVDSLQNYVWVICLILFLAIVLEPRTRMHVLAKCYRFPSQQLSYPCRYAMSISKLEPANVLLLC